MNVERGLIYKILRILLYPWISRVRLLQVDMNELKQLEQEGQLVFVGNASSFIDFLIVNEIEASTIESVKAGPGVPVCSMRTASAIT